MSALSLVTPGGGGLAFGRMFDFGASPASLGLLLSLALLTHLVPGVHAVPAAGGKTQHYHRTPTTTPCPSPELLRQLRGRAAALPWLVVGAYELFEFYPTERNSNVPRPAPPRAHMPPPRRRGYHRL